MRFKKYSVLPGFGLTMGLTLVYLSLLVLIPLAGLFIRSAERELAARCGARSPIRGCWRRTG